MEQTYCDSYRCIREEQCDDCFMIDHLKECAGCKPYEHGAKKLLVTCECEGTGFIYQADCDGDGVEVVECGTHHESYTGRTITSLMKEITDGAANLEKLIAQEPITKLSATRGGYHF